MTRQHLRTVQKAKALPILFWLSSCVSLSKLVRFSGLWASQKRTERTHWRRLLWGFWCTLAELGTQEENRSLPSILGPGTVRSAWSFSGSQWNELYGSSWGTFGFLNIVPPDALWLTIPFDPILCFWESRTAPSWKKILGEPHHMKNKSSKWVLKENVFPSLPGEECFRAKRGASVCGFRVLSTQPEQRSYTTRGQNREKGRKPEVGLPLWDERGFALLHTACGEGPG